MDVGSQVNVVQAHINRLKRILAYGESESADKGVHSDQPPWFAFENVYTVHSPQLVWTNAARNVRPRDHATLARAALLTMHLCSRS